MKVATEDSTTEINFLRDRNRLFATTHENGHTDNGPETNSSQYDIYCPNGKETTIPNEYKGTWINPHLDCHVERYKTSSDFNLNFNLSNYSHDFQGNDPDQTIIEFELHIFNESAGNISINNPDFPYIAFLSDAVDLGNGGFIVTSLTDLNTIAPRKTNVYVYRIDTYRMSIVRSLAYIF